MSSVGGVRPLASLRLFSTASVGLSLALLGAACDTPKQPESPPVAPPASNPARDDLTSNAPKNPEIAPADTHWVPKAKQEIALAAASLHVGSRTGSADRNASREADHVLIEVPGFQIDALPYPNDPAQPPRRMVNRAEASALCEAEGKRLCSEFEWERACKGDVGREYPSQDFVAEVCARDVAACASPNGVFALGTLGREWTSSRAGRGLGDALRSAVVRGASTDAPRASHRCAARDAATPDSKSESLLFRCCRGPQNDIPYPEESTSEPFKEQAWDPTKLRALLEAMPETRAVAAEFRPFTSEQVTQRLAASGRSHSGIAPWVLAPKGLLWSPVHGEQLGVVAGDTPGGAMLIVYYREASGSPLFGASYLTRGEHEAILVAYKPDVPREVLFSTCWGCGGEGGAIELGPDARVRIAQR